jgi:hypothetical protein
MKPTFGGGDQAPPMSAVAFRLRFRARQLLVAGCERINQIAYLI